MQTLKIDGVKYQYPSCWAEMPFHQWYAFQKSTDKLEMVSILTGVPRELLAQMEYSFAIKLYASFKWMEVLPEKLIKEFTFEGMTYKYDNDFTQITAAQYVDLEEKIKEFAEDSLGAYPGIISILYTTGKYDTAYSKIARSNEAKFRNLTMDLIIPIKNFFLFREKSFSTILQNYSYLQTFRTPTEQPAKSSGKSGGILTRFIRFVKPTVGLSNMSKT